MRSKWIPIIILSLLLGMGVLSAGGLFVREKKGKAPLKLENEVAEEAKPEKEEVKEETYDILGVLREHHLDTQSIVIYNILTRKEEGYRYDLATNVKNRYLRETVVKALPLGGILELYLGEDKKLQKISESREAWDYEGVHNLQISKSDLSMEISGRTYRFDAGLTIVNGRELGGITDILPEKDVFRLRGIGEKVLSISVTEGHGSIDFLNYDEFIGGSIEIGYDVFDTIKENMHYTLREGRYKIVMKNGGLFVNKVIDIERNRIRLLDLAQFKGEMNQNSEVSFQIQPSGASLFIDGREVDAKTKKTLPYGEYLVKVLMEGYKSFDDRIKIEKPSEKIKISLAEEKEEKKSEEKEGSGEEKDLESSEEETYEEEKEDFSEEEEGEEEEAPVRKDEAKKISFVKPLGATVLFDDKVIGVIPCDMVKLTGEHKITIEKDGFSPISYTVDIADDGEDAVFSFPEFIEP